MNINSSSSSVDSNYPFAQHPSRETSYCVLFVDMTGSTSLYEDLGNLQAYQLVNTLIEKLESIIANYQGNIIKTIGDEIMATFLTSQMATSASIEMMRNVKSLQSSNKFPLEIKIGFHYGQVVETCNDVFGDTVNIAARLVALAKSMQILTSGDTADQLISQQKQLTRSLDYFQLKGMHEEINVTEIIWEEREKEQEKEGYTQLLRPDKTLTSKLNLSLSIKYAESDMPLVVALLNKQKKFITLGREKDNDVVIDNHHVSRHHATIELRRDKFVLKDISSNGTYIQHKSNLPLLIRREEVILQERGLISLGTPVSNDNSLIVLYFDIFFSP